MVPNMLHQLANMIDTELKPSGLLKNCLELPSSSPDAVDWLFDGRIAPMKFAWSLYAPSLDREYTLVVRLTNTGIGCAVTGLVSTSLPFNWSQWAENFDSDFRQALMQAVSMVEHAIFKTPLAKDMKKVPFSELTGSAEPEREPYPEPEPERPAKTNDLEAALASKDEGKVIAALRGKVRAPSDTILDVYNLAKELKSNRLMNLVKGLQAESSAVDRLVNQLLESD